MNDYLLKIKEQAIPIVESHQKVLVDVVLRKEFSTNIISIIIDDPVSFTIDIDEVAQINLEILDVVNDYIPDNYYLEVTTLGIERALVTENDFKRAIGQYIYLTTYQKQTEAFNLKEMNGYLLNYNEKEIEVEIELNKRKKIVTIAKDQIAKIRLAIDFRRKD